MVLIGVDPHKGSHTAVVVDDDEHELGRVKVRADRRQLERMLTFAAPFGERTWAIESAGGLGFLLAQQLVRAGEEVVDVPPTLAARVRLLGSGRGSKNDPNDALSTAIAALRDPHLRMVVAEDQAMVLRMLADRYQDLTRLRTQAVCRLHALLAALAPGGVQKRLSANSRARFLRSTCRLKVEARHFPRTISVTLNACADGAFASTAGRGVGLILSCLEGGDFHDCDA